MPLEAYRVCRRIHAALDGQGAFRAGGRRNSPGRRMVYMAQSVALAVLENLVHMSRQDLPTGYVCILAMVPVDIAVLSEADLRADRNLKRRLNTGFGRRLARYPTFGCVEGSLSRCSRRMELSHPQPTASGFRQDCGEAARAVRI
jgi:hypothetical protein